MAIAGGFSHLIEQGSTNPAHGIVATFGVFLFTFVFGATWVSSTLNIILPVKGRCTVVVTDFRNSFVSLGSTKPRSSLSKSASVEQPSESLAGVLETVGLL